MVQFPKYLRRKNNLLKGKEERQSHKKRTNVFGNSISKFFDVKDSSKKR
jgi:hypothetical protein